jgi:hypothetical protein
LPRERPSVSETSSRHAPRLLFLDDHHVECMQGLHRILHSPRKRGAVLTPQHPWEGNCIAVFCPPFWVEEEGVYKQYYECRFAGAKDKSTHVYGIAVSADGLCWERPEIGLVDFGGSKRNNLFPTPDGLRLAHVIHDPDDPDPERRYKALLTVPKARVPVVSADGLQWNRLDAKLPSADAGTIAFDRDRRLFMALLKRQNPATVGRSYDISFSEDFETWSQPRFLFGMDRGQDQQMTLDIIRRRLCDPSQARPLFVDPDPATGWSPDSSVHPIPTWRCECYNFGIVPYQGLYLGVATVYYPTGQSLPERTNADGFNQIQLTASRDLETWTRVADRAPWVETSPLTEGFVGNYDRLQLAAHNGIVVHGDEVRLYYGGMKRRVPQHDRWLDGSPREGSTLTEHERDDWLEDAHGAMCLGVLRRDGFVSLRADDDPGELITRPFTLSGRRIALNLDATGGEARVEALDEDARPLEGLAGEDAATVRGDGLRMPLPWDEARLAHLQGRAIRLRVRMHRCDLYSIGME